MVVRLFFQNLFSNANKGVFCKMGNKAGICAVVNNSRCAVICPPGVYHFSNLHVPGVKGVSSGVVTFCILVRVPFLNRCIDVQNIVHAAPLDHRHTVYVPGKVNNHIARAHVF